MLHPHIKMEDSSALIFQATYHAHNMHGEIDGPRVFPVPLPSLHDGGQSWLCKEATCSQGMLVYSLSCCTGPLSTLPPSPGLSQKGGAHPGLQWQFSLLLHTCRPRRHPLMSCVGNPVCVCVCGVLLTQRLPEHKTMEIFTQMKLICVSMFTKVLLGLVFSCGCDYVQETGFRSRWGAQRIVFRLCGERSVGTSCDRHLISLSHIRKQNADMLQLYQDVLVLLII